MPTDAVTGPPAVAWGVGISAADDFDVLYSEELPRLAGALYAMSGIRSLAEETAQDAFAHAWSRWSRVRTSPSPAGWVYTTAFRLMRRRLLLHRRPPLPTMRDRTDPAERADGQIDLLRALRALPVSQQRVVVLRHMLGFSTLEVAQRLETSETAVRSTLKRAVATLRSTLDYPATGDNHDR